MAKRRPRFVFPPRPPRFVYHSLSQWLFGVEQKRPDLGTLTVPDCFLCLPCGCKRLFLLSRDGRPELARISRREGTWYHRKCGKSLS